MTCRIYPSPYVCDPRPIYGALDALKLSRPAMYGWWGDRPPVRALGDGVKATLFVGGTVRAPTFVVAVANWRHAANSATLEFDWARMEELGGFTGSQGASLRAAPIRGFQPQGVWAISAKSSAQIEMGAKGSAVNEGWLMELVPGTQVN